MRNLVWAILLTGCLCAAGQIISAQTRLDASVNVRNTGGAAVSYRYLFENERFTIPRLTVEFDGEGAGQYSFKRKDGEELTNPLKLTPGLLAQVQMLFDELHFLESSEDYQHKKDFSHLGTMTITQVRNGRERTAKFNYTDNPNMSRLAQIFQNIATQEMRVFELENVRQADPLSMPAQMRMLEGELKGKRLADPRGLVPLLKELKQDENIPLIARNHSERLLQMIQKGK